jgi:hypothetical protein
MPVIKLILTQNAVDHFAVKRVYESKQFLSEYVFRSKLQRAESAIVERPKNFTSFPSQTGL